MKSELDEHLEIDRQKIINSIRLQVPVEVTSYTLPRNMEVYVRKILEDFLDECHQEQIKEYLNFCLGELLTNAKKANTKRVYFKDKGLDINNPDDYAKGMETFKDETMDNIDYYLELQRKEGLYVKLSLQLDFDKVIIEIRNNAVLTSFEEERIAHKLDSVQQYKSMDEVVSKVLDTTEGAGLGIIIISLMLQKIGLSKEDFTLFSANGETITRIVFPCNKKVYDGITVITSEFVEKIDSIPVPKDSFAKINKLSEENPINRDEMLKVLQNDCTLALVAAKESLKHKVDEFDLISILRSLSDDELKYLFSDSNPSIRQIDCNEEIKKLWMHSTRTAFYAYNLAKNSGNNLSDGKIFLLGLFNDIGLILVKTQSESSLSNVKDVCAQYGDLSSGLYDLFMSGNAATFVNFAYMKKLGFDDGINKLMSAWNCMRLMPESLHPTLHILYLAEMIQYYDEKIVDFYQIRKDILNEFNISNEADLKQLIANLKSVQ